MKNIIKLDTTILSAASVVGKKEYEGPYGDEFDIHDETDKFGEDTWEKAESSMQRAALNTAILKSGIDEGVIDALFAGDLMNQCTGSAYGLLGFDMPYFGLYGACSTAAESLMLASIMTSYGAFDYCGAITSSHFCSAERQYRNPLEYGGQRPPTSQWTVTGSGAFIVGKGGRVRVTEALPGIVIEKGIRDANNMGAAMAPAAADTLLRYYSKKSNSICDIDVIVTGDLGFEGSEIFKDLISKKLPEISDKLTDCGMLIYDRKAQDVHSGGSGCGCSAVMLAAHFLPKLECGEIKKMIFMATGAMMSPMTLLQGEAIPGIAHLLVLESVLKDK